MFDPRPAGVPSAEHVPDATYRCRVDGRPWPCAAAQAAHLEEYRRDPGALLLRMADHAARAARVHPDMPSILIARQFFGWIPDGWLRQPRMRQPRPVRMANMRR